MTGFEADKVWKRIALYQFIYSKKNFICRANDAREKTLHLSFTDNHPQQVYSWLMTCFLSRQILTGYQVPY